MTAPRTPTGPHNTVRDMTLAALLICASYALSNYRWQAQLSTPHTGANLRRPSLEVFPKGEGLLIACSSGGQQTNYATLHQVTTCSGPWSYAGSHVLAPISAPILSASGQDLGEPTKYWCSANSSIMHKEGHQWHNHCDTWPDNTTCLLTCQCTRCNEPHTSHTDPCETRSEVRYGMSKYATPEEGDSALQCSPKPQRETARTSHDPLKHCHHTDCMPKQAQPSHEQPINVPPDLKGQLISEKIHAHAPIRQHPRAHESELFPLLLSQLCWTGVTCAIALAKCVNWIGALVIGMWMMWQLGAALASFLSHTWTVWIWALLLPSWVVYTWAVILINYTLRLQDTVLPIWAVLTWTVLMLSWIWGTWSVLSAYRSACSWAMRRIHSHTSRYVYRICITVAVFVYLGALTMPPTGSKTGHEYNARAIRMGQVLVVSTRKWGEMAATWWGVLYTAWKFSLVILEHKSTPRLPRDWCVTLLCGLVLGVQGKLGELCAYTVILYCMNRRAVQTCVDLAPVVYLCINLTLLVSVSVQMGSSVGMTLPPVMCGLLMHIVTSHMVHNILLLALLCISITPHVLCTLLILHAVLSSCNTNGHARGQVPRRIRCTRSDLGNTPSLNLITCLVTATAFLGYCCTFTVASTCSMLAYTVLGNTVRLRKMSFDTRNKRPSKTGGLRLMYMTKAHKDSTRWMRVKIMQQEWRLPKQRPQGHSPIDMIRTMDGTHSLCTTLARLATSLQPATPRKSSCAALHMHFSYDITYGRLIRSNKGPVKATHRLHLTPGTEDATMGKANKPSAANKPVQRTEQALLWTVAMIWRSHQLTCLAITQTLSMSRLLIQTLLSIGGVEKNPGPTLLSAGESMFGMSDTHAAHILCKLRTRLRALRSPAWLNDGDFINLCHDLYQQLPPQTACPSPILSYQVRDLADDISFKAFGARYYPDCTAPFCTPAAEDNIAVKHIEGDGACMYRSTMMAVTGDQRGHLCLRLRATLYLVLYQRAHCDHSWSLATLTGQLCCDKATESANVFGWSSQLNIMCAANVLGRTITILNPQLTASSAHETVTYRPLDPTSRVTADWDTPIILSWSSYSPFTISESSKPDRFVPNHFVALIPSNARARACLPFARSYLNEGRGPQALQEHYDQQAAITLAAGLDPIRSRARDAILADMMLAPPLTDVARPWSMVCGKSGPVNKNALHPSAETRMGQKGIDAVSKETTAPTADRLQGTDDEQKRRAMPPTSNNNEPASRATGEGADTSKPGESWTAPPPLGQASATQHQEDSKHEWAADKVMKDHKQAEAPAGCQADHDMGRWGDRIQLDGSASPVTARTEKPPCKAKPQTRGKTAQTGPSKTAAAVQTWKRVTAGVPPPAHNPDATYLSQGKKAKFVSAESERMEDQTPGLRSQPHHRADDMETAPPAMDRLRILTQNCRGLLCNAVALGLIIEEHSPHIVFLTETKMISNKNRPTALTALLHDYQWAISSTPRKDAKSYHIDRPRAGVIVAVHNTYSAGGRMQAHEPCPGLAGYVCHTALRTLDDTVLHLVGVYAPEDTALRAQIFEYLSTICRMCEGAGHAILIGGDWNAVLSPHDRSTNSLDTADRAYGEFTTSARLMPLHTPGSARNPTYSQTTEGEITHNSRIDDVLTLQSLATRLASATLEGTVTEMVHDAGGNLDHSPLIHDVRHPNLCLRPAQVFREVPVQNKPRLLLPITKAYLEKARLAIAASQGASAARLRLHVGQVATGLVDRLEGDHTAQGIARLRKEMESKDPHGQVDELARQLQLLVGGGLDTMMMVCPTRAANTGKMYMKRTATRQQRALYKQVQGLKSLLRATKEARQDGDLTSTRIMRIMAETHTLQTSNSVLCKHLCELPISSTDPQTWQEWEVSVGRDITRLAGLFRSATNMSRAISQDKARRKFQAKMSVNPKTAHRDMFNPVEGTPGGPHAIRHPETGEVEHTQLGVLSAMYCFFSRLMTPRDGPKSGKYLPKDVTRDMPWSSKGMVDCFDLTTPAVETRDTACLLNSIMDRELLNESLRHLSRGKRGGPDGIPNELLQILPEDALHALHSLFILMWITGKTPTLWKESNTILLYKKGDSLDPGNYRPIALANTLYKLWSSTITTMIAKHAEDHHMLSSGQEGFRSHKNTSRQLRNLLQVIEDAALTGSNLYILYVDFSSAFNMVDQDKLLVIMYDLGFPTDAIEIIKGIYTDSTTRVQAAGGTSTAINVDRGTIQGDTLSPLLFLIFLEPLLRWLHSGGRGYRYGCLSRDENDQYNCSTLAYADDLAIPVSTLANLKVQTNKIEQFNAWSGLQTNAPKCSVTGILYGDYMTGLTPCNNSPNNTRTLKRQLEGTIRIGGHAIPFLAPDKAYRYLGVWITLTLDWGPQLRASLQKTRDKGQALIGSMASQRQKLHSIQMCIKTAITYCFCLAPYTAADIDALDKEVVSIAKACCNLPKGTPTAAVLLGKDSAGLGVLSLWEDYVQVNGAALSRSISDDGRLGIVTRGLLMLQNKKVGDMMAADQNKQARFYTGLKQLAMCKKYGMSVVYQGARLDVTHNAMWNKLVESSMHFPTDKRAQIQSHIMLPLAELGLTLHDLIDPDGIHIIDSDALDKLVGKKTQHRHKVALNKATLILTQNYGPVTDPCKHKTSAPLSLEERLLPHTWTHSDVRRSDTMPRSIEGVRYGSATAATPTHAPTIGANKRGRTITQPRKDTEQNAESPLTSPPGKASKILQAQAEQRKSDAKSQGHLEAFLRTSRAKHHNATGQPWTLLTPDRCTCSEHRHVKKVLDIQAVIGDQATQNDTNRHMCLVAWERSAYPAICAHNHKLSHLLKGHTAADETLSKDHAQVTLTWVPTWTTGKELEHQLGGKIALKQYHSRKAKRDRATFEDHVEEQPLLVPPRLDTHLTNDQQQGCWDTVLAQSTEYDKLMRKMVKLCSTAVNPDVDILPSNRYRTQIGVLEGDQLKHPECAYVYQPSGVCIGHMNLATLETLKWSHRREQEARNIGLPTGEEPNYVYEDLAALMLRHTARRKLTGMTDCKDQWVAQERMMMALARLGMTQDRFASPLNRSRHMPVYYSEHLEDLKFGSRGNAFSVPWKGASFAHPGQDHGLMATAMRWAIGSSLLSNCPTLCLMLLPDLPESLYATFTNHRSVHMLCRMTNLRLLQPEHWQNNKGEQGNLKQVKNPYILLAIGNDQGTAAITTDPSRWAEFADEWEQVTGARPIAPMLHDHSPGHGENFKIPRVLTEMVELSGSQEPPTVPEGWQNLLPTDAQGTPGPHQPPAWDPMRGVYTDGSCIKDDGGQNRLGAAVWRKQNGTPKLWLVNPNGLGPTNTINRAELSALHLALTLQEVVTYEEELTIYTDSLCSIQMINKIIREPRRMKESKHLEMLQAIAMALKLRAKAGGTTTIHKVKSHSGVEGNDQADKGAADMAKGHPASEPAFEPSTNIPYQTVAMLAYETGDSPMFFDNLTAAPKKFLSPALQAGRSNDTMYVKLNREALLMADGKLSFHQWVDPTVPHQTCRHAYMAIWGLPWNQKKAFRYNRAANSTCPLCPEEDGTTHMYSACLHKNMQGHYISRHNKAVLIIYEGIQQGAMGGSLCIIDATRKDELPDDAESSRMPEWLLPTTPAEDRKRMRPDIMLIQGMPANGIDAYLSLGVQHPGRGTKRERPNSQTSQTAQTNHEKQRFRSGCTIHIIEVTYGSHTRYIDKIVEKTGQHDRLMDALRSEGWKVQYHIVVLGVAGTIFNNTVKILDDLQIPPAPRQTTLHALNRLAVQKIHEILVCRRRLEHEGPVG